MRALFVCAALTLAQGCGLQRPMLDSDAGAPNDGALRESPRDATAQHDAALDAGSPIHPGAHDASTDASPNGGGNDAGPPALDVVGCAYDEGGFHAIEPGLIRAMAWQVDGLSVAGDVGGVGGVWVSHIDPSTFTEAWSASRPLTWLVVNDVTTRGDSLLVAAQSTAEEVRGALLFEVDSDGALTQRDFVPGPLDSITSYDDLVVLPSGGVRLVGEQNDRIWLRELDASFALAGETRLAIRGYGDAIAYHPSDGGSVIVGHSTSDGTGWGHVIRLDAAHAVRWEVTRDSRGRDFGAPEDVVVLPGGDIVVAGWGVGSPRGGWLARFDDTGAEVWNVRVDTPWANLRLIDIALIAPDRLLVLGSKLHGSGADEWRDTAELFLFDADSGAVLARDSLGDAANDRSPYALATWVDASGALRFAIAGTVGVIGSGRFGHSFVHTGTCETVLAPLE